MQKCILLKKNIMVKNFAVLPLDGSLLDKRYQKVCVYQDFPAYVISAHHLQMKYIYRRLCFPGHLYIESAIILSDIIHVSIQRSSLVKACIQIHYISVFLISSYGAPLAQSASYLAMDSSLFGPVAQLIMIILSLTALTVC